MSQKNNKTKRFVIIMSILVIVIISIGSWLTWKIVEDGMDKEASQVNLFKNELDQTIDK